MKDLILTSFLLGIGLAMDAFCVSLASGLNEPGMSGKRAFAICGTFGAFQFFMPLIGWVCVHTISEWFAWFEKLIPWIALALLGFIGIKMIVEGLKGKEEDKAAGMSACLVYDRHNQSRIERAKEIADHYIKSYEGLELWI